MKFFEKIRKKHIAFVLVILTSFLLVHIVQADTPDPASPDDPLVTQGYVDNKIAQLAAIIDGMKQQLQNTQGQGGTSLEKVSVKAGHKIIGGAGTEFILRTGQATAVGSANGGLSDVTGGKDIQTGGVVAYNHLLIMPMDDGRGLKITKDAYVLVRGSYTIQ